MTMILDTLCNGTDFVVDNVIGDIPGYEDLTVIGQKTVDMVGIGQAKQKTEIVK